MYLLWLCLGLLVAGFIYGVASEYVKELKLMRGKKPRYDGEWWRDE